MQKPTMKAVVCTKYGSPDYLEIRDVPMPQLKAKDVLIKVHATTVTKADTMMRNAEPFISRLFLGFTKPRKDIMGTGFAGQIVAIGNEVQQFKIGDKVFGETGVNFGANAEYIGMPEDGVISQMPSNMSYEEAAPICDGPMTSYNFLRSIATIQEGQEILINGASGSLGTAAIQLAKYYGAKVTAVCGPNNVELVKNLGADKVINYHTTDFSEFDQTYDIIYDAVGKRSFSGTKKVLKPQGRYLTPVLSFAALFQMIGTKFSQKKALFSATGLKPSTELRQSLEALKTIIEAGQLKMVIDKRYPLDQAIAAHRYVDIGHKKGNVVLFPFTNEMSVNTAKEQQYQTS